MIVLDASALLHLLMRTEHAEAVDIRLDALGGPIHAPHLIDIESAHVLRRNERSNRMSARRASEALADLEDFPIRRHGHSLLLPRIWEMRNNLTAYDAAYVALAEALDAPLVTCDARLAAAPGHRARVEVV